MHYFINYNGVHQPDIGDIVQELGFLGLICIFESFKAGDNKELNKFYLIIRKKEEIIIILSECNFRQLLVSNVHQI